MHITVNARTCVFAALSQVLGGCAVSLQGLVSEDGPGTRLQTVDGQVYRLVTVGEAAPVARLQDHFVRIQGTRVFRTVTVTDWSVPEGLHGMTAWVGELQGLGAQVGVQDRNSKSFYYLDPDAARTLGGHVGDVVLVEGYVYGPMRVEVVYYRVLGPGPVSPEPVESPL